MECCNGERFAGARRDEPGFRWRLAAAGDSRFRTGMESPASSRAAALFHRAPARRTRPRSATRGPSRRSRSSVAIPFTTPPPISILRRSSRSRRCASGLAFTTTKRRALCQWFLPEAHALETWSDARAFDGTATIMQPLIEPLYAGKSAHELLAALTGDALASGYEIVRGFWRSQHDGADFEKLWRKSLHDGVSHFQLPIANLGNAARAASSTGQSTIGNRQCAPPAHPSRPAPARWALCQQRLAAGTSDSRSPKSLGTMPRSFRRPPRRG